MFFQCLDKNRDVYDWTEASIRIVTYGRLIEWIPAVRLYAQLINKPLSLINQPSCSVSKMPSALLFSHRCKHSPRWSQGQANAEASVKSAVASEAGVAAPWAQLAYSYSAAPPRQPNTTRWQMHHGSYSPYHLFFGASLPNTRLSVLQPRTEWNTATIMEKRLIMHYQLVPLATDRCLAGGTRPFHSFRAILSFSNPHPTLNLLFPSVH